MPRNKKKIDTDAMFASLAQDRKPPSTPKTNTETVESTPRRKQPIGKRKDPNYIQVGAYIPKDLNKEVKRKLIDHEGNFSDLVEELLEAWVND